MYKQIKNLMLCAGLVTGLMLGLVGNATAAKKEAAPAAVEAPAAPAAPVAAPAAVAPVAAPAAEENPYGLAALWAQGDAVAKGTLLIMIIMSMGSWYVIFTKLAEQSKGLSPEVWAQMMSQQAPLMQGVMGSYMDQSKQLFTQMLSNFGIKR